MGLLLSTETSCRHRIFALKVVCHTAQRSLCRVLWKKEKSSNQRGQMQTGVWAGADSVGVLSGGSPGLAGTLRCSAGEMQ